MDSNVRAARTSIPVSLWQALAAEGLIPDRLIPMADGQ
jgi:hypothetical protein